jgi:protoporphyrinogen oxidase
MKVAIIGGGAAGLSTGYQLTKAGVSVDLFERDKTLGGLAGSFLLSGGYVEKFYHFICLNDTTYLETLKNLGLSDRLKWKLTEMGQFYQGRLYSFGRPLDLFRFPALTWNDRIRFATRIMKIKSAPWNDWKKIESVPVDEWLENTFGSNVYRSLHEPMVRLKFGKYTEKLSAAWMWARIHRLGRSRTKIRQREKIGYVEGGSQRIMDALGEKIIQQGGTITLNASVERLLSADNRIRGIVVNGNENIYDVVVSTVPLPAFLRLVPDSWNEDYWNKLRNIESIGVLCVFLRTSRKFSKYFWTNISDERIQLAGIIEYTNLNPLPHLGGDSIIYLPQYLPSSLEKFSMPNDKIIQEYVSYLKLINPEFDERYIKEAFVFREKYAQPICEVGFTKDMPDIRTPVRGLYLTDSSQLHPDDRTISNSLGLGEQAAKLVLEDSP